MIDFLNKQWLIVGLIGAVSLAFVIPNWGANGGYLRSETTTPLGIMLVFFLQGWVLPSEVLAKGVLRWKTHLIIQAYIFLCYPAVVFAGDLIWRGLLADSLRIGFFFLAVVPTTITSAIIYTYQSEGNTAVALFNTTVANMAGVIITPLWMTVFVQSEMGQMGDLGAVFLKLTQLVLLPFCVGQLAHFFTKAVAVKLKGSIGHVNQAVIIFIVFAAFSNSVAGGAWETQGWWLVGLTVALCLGLFFVVNGLALWLIRLRVFSDEDKSAVFFCATQKTLATGVSFANSLFGTDPALGIILLPLMVFHPVQLLLGGLLIPWFRDQNKPLQTNRAE